MRGQHSAACGKTAVFAAYNNVGIWQRFVTFSPVIFASACDDKQMQEPNNVQSRNCSRDVGESGVAREPQQTKRVDVTPVAKIFMQYLVEH